VILSVLAYVGLALVLAGAVAVVRPRFMGRRTPGIGMVLLPAGVVLACAGAWWPVGVQQATGDTLLDELLPESHFGEVHTTRVRAAPERIFRAVHAVTADEMRYFRVLTWIRSPRLPWRRGTESVLAPDWHAPILDVALRSGFVLLGEIPETELVVGTVVCCGTVALGSADGFQALETLDYARAAMSFRVEALPDGASLLTTETRVAARAPSVRRRFGLYWSFIYPGSALIRRGWLEAIRRRAETAP
jgi:hypothetical protein